MLLHLSLLFPIFRYAILLSNLLLGFYSTDFANLLGSGTLANKSSVKVSFCVLVYMSSDQKRERLGNTPKLE